MFAFVIGPGPGRHKRGPVGRKLEQVQAEIVAHYHNRLPPELVHINALHRAINKRRKKRGLGMVGRMTVKRALRTLRDKNS